MLRGSEEIPMLLESNIPLKLLAGGDIASIMTSTSMEEQEVQRKQLREGRMSVSTGGHHKGGSGPFSRKKKARSHNLELTLSSHSCQFFHSAKVCVHTPHWISRQRHAKLFGQGERISQGGSCGDKRRPLTKKTLPYDFTSLTNAKHWAICPKIQIYFFH